MLVSRKSFSCTKYSIFISQIRVKITQRGWRRGRARRRSSAPRRRPSRSLLSAPKTSCRSLKSRSKHHAMLGPRDRNLKSPFGQLTMSSIFYVIPWKTIRLHRTDNTLYDAIEIRRQKSRFFRMSVGEWVGRNWCYEIRRNISHRSGADN